MLNDEKICKMQRKYERVFYKQRNCAKKLQKVAKV